MRYESADFTLSIMKVAFVQLEPKFGDIKTNVDKAIAMMKSTAAELYVLPELFSTGYVFVSREEAFSLAERPGQENAFSALANFALRSNSGIVFGFAEKALEGLFNSCAFIDGKNPPAIYRKLHLFYKEKEIFLPGIGKLQIIQHKDARIGMMVCFDWIFPEVCRNLALTGAQIICHPANLVMPYCQQAMITRSLENRVFAITANRIGKEDREGQVCHFTGQSQITDYRGNVLYRSSANKEEIFAADINATEADNKDVNKFNNLWRDRRIGFD